MIALKGKEKISLSGCGHVDIALLILFALCFWAWQGDCLAKNGTGSTSHLAMETKKIADYQKRLDQLLSPVTYHYSPAGKPDPFMPFFRTGTSGRENAPKIFKKKKKPTKCDTPLACMDVGQLTLVGIVQEGDGQVIAMAQDASGIGYTLKPGMKIGYRKGRIVAIEKEKVVVREQVENIQGKLTYRDRVLYLHPEESDAAK